MLDSNTTLTIQLSAHDCMQYSYFQTGLLQRHPLQSSLDKLQWVQNNLARVVCQRSRITDARPLLQSLHWLPIRERNAHPVQDGALDIQDTARLHHTWQICYNFDHQQDRCGPLTLHCRLYHEHRLHWRRAPSLWLRPLSGTVYRPTSGRATRCGLSDVIWKLIILPQRVRNVASPAPLYLQSSRCSTSPIIIIIIIIILLYRR